MNKNDVMTSIQILTGVNYEFQGEDTHAIYFENELCSTMEMKYVIDDSIEEGLYLKTCEDWHFYAERDLMEYVLEGISEELVAN